MNCQVCGSKLKEQEKFCGECGAPRPGLASQPPPPGFTPPIQPTIQVPSPVPPIGQPSWQSKQKITQARPSKIKSWIYPTCALLTACLGLIIPLFYLLNQTIFQNDSVIDWLAGSMATKEPPQVESTVQGNLAISFQHAGFLYDANLARDVEGSVVPEDAGNSFSTYPEHLLFSFHGYPITASMHSPELRVYPTTDYESINDTAREIIFAQRIMLSQKPAMIQGDIPFLPVWNAGQLIHAQVKYLNFINGIGIRFITQFGQNISPINNKDLMYTFQGMTYDGTYYISMVMPISHPDLPPDGSEIPGGDYLKFDQEFSTYAAQVTQQLNQASPSSFFPDLASLDDIILSLVIEP